MAITKSSKAISKGANAWFESEVGRLNKEMKLLDSITPDEVQMWRNRLNSISGRFRTAISYLNEIIAKAEKGKLVSISEIHPPEKKTLGLPPLRTAEEREEEKPLDLVSAILEVFDSASDLEELINEVEKEIKRTIWLAKMAIEAVQKG